MTLRSINPASMEIIAEFEELSDKDIKNKISISHETFNKWKRSDFEVRSKLMQKAADLLRENKSKYAKIITSEVGKTIKASEMEVEKCAVCCEYYAHNAKDFLKNVEVRTDASESFVSYEPLGPVLAVMPWNFPFWQVIRFAAPALMAGNTGILKHASNVQLSGQALQNLFEEAGFPAGAFLNLEISSSKVEQIINDDRVMAVTLTGSEYAGSQVAKQAGENIKKTVLELGGSDPFIVLDDANIEDAVSTALSARLQMNGGQSCIAAKRFIVHEKIADKFTKLLSDKVSNLIIGDPTDENTDVGPLANEQMVSDIEKQINDSVEMGAEIKTGGSRANLRGCYFYPTVITNTNTNMPVLKEEVFGPAWPIIKFNKLEEAINIANSSPYGLGATIFSSNTDQATVIASEIESGCVFINSQVKSDPRLPFGGIKKSGYGRELSEYGIKEFVNIKTVWVK